MDPERAIRTLYNYLLDRSLLQMLLKTLQQLSSILSFSRFPSFDIDTCTDIQ